MGTIIIRSQRYGKDEQQYPSRITKTETTSQKTQEIRREVAISTIACLNYGYMQKLPRETQSPPLHLQLLALSSKDLERRIARFFEKKFAGDNNKNRIAGHRQRVHRHAYLACQLAKKLNNQWPTIHDVMGISLDSTVTEP